MRNLIFKNLNLLKLVTILSMFAFIGYGCGGGGGDDSNSGDPAPLFDTPTESFMIDALKGGVITTYSGMSLIIPPNALEEDTEISTTEVDIEALNGDPEDPLSDVYIIGCTFEPHDLVFKKPVKLVFPLPPDWEENSDIPLLLETSDEDPATALPISKDITITGSYGAFKAEVEVSHFSTKILSRNCFSGALKTVMFNFESRDCPREYMFLKVSDRYGIKVNENNAKTCTQTPFQAFIDTYFEDFGTFDKDLDLTPAQIQTLIEYAKKGRQVVLAFSHEDKFPKRMGDKNNFFYSTHYAHAAVLEVDKNGDVQMHHWFPKPGGAYYNNPGTIKILKDIGGDWNYTYPMEKINEYRKLQDGVAFELYICKINGMAPDPGCLSVEKRNPYNLQPYKPLDGYSDWYGNNSPPRSVAYPSVHIYIEKAGGPPHDPCLVDETGCLDGGYWRVNFQYSCSSYPEQHTMIFYPGGRWVMYRSPATDGEGEWTLDGSNVSIVETGQQSYHTAEVNTECTQITNGRQFNSWSETPSCWTATKITNYTLL